MKRAILVLAALMLSACAPAPIPSPSASAVVSPAPSPSVTASPSASPSASLPSPSPSVSLPPTVPPESVSCTPDRGLPAAGDPCPAAVAAVRKVVKELGGTISRIYLVPAPFPCGGLWPGVGSPVICFGPIVLPGRTMHGWVRFLGTDRVAAVSLARDLPIGEPIPSPLPPWRASIEAFVVPPTGWQMP
jgi:hypothetical protein